jgi:hypothetical protein
VRPAGCRSDDLLGGLIRVSRSRLKFKVSRLARTPGICETGPGGDREELPRGRCDADRVRQGLDHEQNHRPPSGYGCGLQAGSTDKTSGTKAERRVPGARFERWERSHRARSVCGSHDPPHRPKEGRLHAPTRTLLRHRPRLRPGLLLALDRLFQLLGLLDWFVGPTVLGWLRWLGRLGRDRGMRLGGRLLGLGWPGRLDLACTCDLTGGPGFRGDRVPP